MVLNLMIDSGVSAVIGSEGGNSTAISTVQTLAFNDIRTTPGTVLTVEAKCVNHVMPLGTESLSPIHLHGERDVCNSVDNFF